MSATRIRPEFSAVIPSFTSWSVTVTVGRTARSVPKPLGTSTLRVGFPEAFIWRMSAAYGSRRGPSTPIPRRASINRSAAAIASSLLSSPARICTSLSRSKFVAASGVANWSGERARRTVTRTSFARWRAATRPSPPLFPVPQRTRTFFPAAPNSDRATSATAFPAFSISSKIETPKYWAFRSRTRISAGEIIARASGRRYVNVARGVKNNRTFLGAMDVAPLRAYTWALLLGLFVPVSWILDLILGPGVIVFAAAGLAIVPLAWFLGLATEELGKHAGPGVGGLLNATFGNATELIIAIFALSRGLTEVVKASLTGSIVGNLLLVLGLSMLAGGVKYKVQHFSREASGIQITMLVVAVIGLVMPALYVLSTGIRSGVTLEEMSLGIAGILLLAYVFGLFFSLRTHRDIFNPVSEVVEKPRWEKRFALSVLVVSTVLVAVESEILVGSLETARQSLGLTELFVGVIIVAIVGNAAEHGSAVLMAWRNKMELSVAVATTSTTQVALFVAPILVFVSLLTAKVMTLDFEIFELASLALATAVVAAVISDGRSNWYEGALLVMVYAVIAVAFLFHPPPP